MKNNKERLFELMRLVGKMPINENISDKPTLPSWAMPYINKFISKEKYDQEVPCNTNVTEDLSPKTQEIENPEDWLRKKDYGISKGVKQAGGNNARISSLMMANSRIGDYNVANRNAKKLTDFEKTKLKLKDLSQEDFEDIGYDLNILKDILLKRPSPSQLIGQNTKMGKTNFYELTLPAFRGIYYDKHNDKFFIINICDKAGVCSKQCFGLMGRYIIYDSIIRLNAQRLNFLLNDSQLWKQIIINQINALFDGTNNVVIRWHDTGDFFSEEYMLLGFEIASKTDNTLHYAYTKEIGMAKSLNNQKPDNFEIKYSYGGKEDHLIDAENDGYSIVIPKKIFKGLKLSSEESIKQLKINISNYLHSDYKFSVKPEQLITYQEMLSIPYNNKNPRSLFVIVTKEDGDMAALRKDVKGVFLLEHK